MFRKILVPLDGSETAAKGLDEAMAVAKVFGASVHLVHVIEAVPMAAEMMTGDVWQALIEGLQANGESLLAKAAARAEAVGVRATRRVLSLPGERVADAILDEARAASCDLIVMGTHGRRGFQHLMLGSDAERVLRLSPLPVLAVRHPEARR